MTRPSLWMLSEVFYPDQTSTGYIMTDIASELALDQTVNVICGPAGYEPGGHSEVLPLSTKIKITRVKLWKWNKNSIIQRVIRLVVLSIKMSLQLIKSARKGDKVIIVTNPAPLLLLAAAICRWKGLKLIIIIHDVFPENLKAGNMISDTGLSYKFLLRLFNQAYQTADHLIVLGRDMKRLFQNKLAKFPDEKISIIENWADTENVYPEDEVRNGRVKLQFAGNFGVLQGLIPFINSLKLADNKNLEIDFIGSGAMLSKMKSSVSENGLENIHILPPFERSQQRRILNDCDICIVSLTEGMLGLGVPSKTYNILAAGKPILYIGDKDSEISLVIQEEDIGWKFENYGEELVSFLKELHPDLRPEFRSKGKNAHKLALKTYSKAILLEKYKKIVNTI